MSQADDQERTTLRETQRSHVAFAATVLLGAIAATGCGHDEPVSGQPAGSPGPRGGAGPAVAVEGKRLEAGFARGHMRESIDVSSFSISRHPITLGEYRACVKAGACEVPPESACTRHAEGQIIQRPNFDQEGPADDVAVTCVGLRGARQYCSWTGGRLPTFEQWLLAARGPQPKRFAWGSTPATCERHPLGWAREGVSCPREKVAIGKVEQHPTGASPFRVLDVLLTSAELLDTSEQAMFSACQTDEKRKAGGDRACLVYGTDPGAIDTVEELRSTAKKSETSSIAYGFRCAWGGAS